MLLIVSAASKTIKKSQGSKKKDIEFLASRVGKVLVSVKSARFNFECVNRKCDCSLRKS